MRCLNALTGYPAISVTRSHGSQTLPDATARLFGTSKQMLSAMVFRPIQMATRAA
ncbi:hypothetical protein [Paenirhodobacter sp.]|uniref:hypothetical protein n=1 Tax=Paenirhodobacter sp. TaxID=1965326 RepID=UPI003B3EC1C6